MSLHTRIAAALGWAEEQAKSYSLQALRDLVRPVSAKLSHELDIAIQGGSCVLPPDEEDADEEDADEDPNAYDANGDKIDGYHDCDCCEDIIIDQRLCDGCLKAGCEANGEGFYNDCQIPQCFDCCEGDGPRASLMNDGKWHSNCDKPCVNAGKSWEAT